MDEINKLKAEIRQLKAEYVTARLDGWIDGFQHAADTAAQIGKCQCFPVLRDQAQKYRSRIKGIYG
jgi:hypothetical protein